MFRLCVGVRCYCYYYVIAILLVKTGDAGGFDGARYFDDYL